jgi:L-cystine uptake protein TcyP (sodium:dicarboxylate symporter family)
MLQKLLASIFLGFLVAALMMYVAWEHNSQCEIYCEGSVNWLYWLSIGFSWFLPVSISTFLFASLISKIVRKRSENESAT